MMNRLVALTLAVLLLGASASPATAAEGSEDDIATWTVDTATGPSTRLQFFGSKCYYAYWIAQAKNVVGVVLFQYKEQVDWCANSTKITAVDRFTTPITPKPWIWRYDGETLFPLSYNVTKTTVTARARGTFTQLLPPLGIEIGQSHPTVTIVARRNGTAEGTISW